MALYESVAQTIGNTPLVRVKNFEKENGLEAEVYAKLEYFNPAGSVKDRVAKAIIDDAVASGRIKPGSTIIEPTSGNTGIGIASYAAANGYASDKNMRCDILESILESKMFADKLCHRNFPFLVLLGAALDG